MKERRFPGERLIEEEIEAHTLPKKLPEINQDPVVPNG
jgi:hypothetical protein